MISKPRKCLQKFDKNKISKVQTPKPVQEVFSVEQNKTRVETTTPVVMKPHNMYKSHITYKCTFVHASDDVNATTMNSYACATS